MRTADGLRILQIGVNYIFEARRAGERTHGSHTQPVLLLAQVNKKLKTFEVKRQNAVIRTSD